MDTIKTTTTPGIDETKKVIELVGDFATKLETINWKKVGIEVSDLDESEKKELIGIVAKKVLEGLLLILA